MTKLFRSNLIPFILFLLFFNFSVFAESSEQKNILVPVNDLHDALKQSMIKAETDSRDTRINLLEPVIHKNFDIALISRVVLGRYWDQISSDEQQEFMRLFEKLTVATYVNRFDAFNNETFENETVKKIKENRYFVKTKLIVPDDEPVSFEYIVQNSDKDSANWKIISVIANGINDLALKKAEYSSVIKDKGYGALVSDLKQKIIDLDKE